MLGKNNFKERLRRMEEQNKKERFSIRKLSIGAASVLIGFAFMGMEAQTVQADQVTSTVKQEVKAAGDQATVKIDKPVASAPAAEQIATPKTGEASKQTVSDQSAVVVKNDNSEQNKKPQAVNKNDAKNVQTEAQDQTAKNDSAATEPNKQNSTTAETHEAQKTTGQTTQVDQSQNRTSNRESTTNDQHNANSGNVELDKNDQVRNQNNQVTDKANDVENAVSQLQKAMNQATVLASKTNLNQNLTAEQKSQLQQIDEIVSSGQALTASLRSNPENSDNRGNGNSVNGQTLNVSRLSKMTHNLNGIMSRLYEVRNTYVNDGRVMQNISTADDFQKAIRDQTTTVMAIRNDIDLSNTAYNLSVSDGKPALSISGLGHLPITLKMGNNRILTERPNITVSDLTIDTSGGGGFSLRSADLTTTFENCNFKNINGNFINGYNNTTGNTLHFKGNNRIISTGNLGSSAFSIFSGGNIIVDGSFVSDPVLPQSLFYSLGLTVNGTLKAKYSYNATRNPFINIYGYAVNQGVHFGSNTNIDISGTGSSAFGVTNARGANISFDIPSGAEVNLNSGSSTPIYSDLDVSSHVNINLQGNSKLSLSGSNGIIAGNRGVEVTANNGSSLIINTTGNQNNTLTINANNPRLISLKTTGGSIDTSHVSFNTNQQAGLYLGKADGRVGSWQVSGIRGTVGNGTITSTAGYYGKTSLSEISQKGLASANYKYSSASEYHDLTSDNSFSDLIYSIDEEKTELRTNAGRDDVTAAVVTAHVVDENGKEKLESADQYIHVADPSLVTNIKWINNVITQNSYNNYYPTNSTSNTPVSTKTGAITVDNNGNVTLNRTLGTVGINSSNATIAVTYQDGTVDYVPVKINIVSAKAKNGSVQTTETSSQTNPISVNFKEPSDTNAAGLIANGSDLSNWSPNYTFVDAAGNAISSFGSGTDITGDPNHKLVETNIKVQYHNGGAADGTQTIQHVWLKMEKTLADQFSPQITAKTGLKVLDGAAPLIDDALDYGNMTQAQKNQIASTSSTNDPTNHSIIYTISFGNSGADGTLTRTVHYELVPRATAKTGLTFNADGHETNNSSVTIANGNSQGEALLNWGSNTTEPTGQAYSVSGLTYTDNTNTYLHAGAQTPTVKVQLADNVITSGAAGVTTDASGHKSYNVSVPITVNGIGDLFNSTSNAHGDNVISAHVVNVGSATDYANGLLSTSDSISYTDADGVEHHNVSLSSLDADRISWATTPDLTQIDPNGTDHEATVHFADNSTVNIKFKVKVSGATVNTNANTQISENGILSNDQAKNAVNSSTIGHFVDINNAENYSWAKNADGTGTPNTAYNANATNGDQEKDRHAYVVVQYTDGTKQTVYVPYHVKSQADDTNSDSIHVANDGKLSIHVNANGSELTKPEVTIGTNPVNAANIDWVKNDHGILTNDNLTNKITDQGLNPTTGKKIVNDVYLRIKHSDGSYSYSDALTITVVGGYKNADQTVNAISNDITSLPGATTAIKNWADLHDNFHAANAEWAKNASGSRLDNSYINSNTNTAKPAWVKITYSDGKTQIVQVNDLHITAQNNHYTPEPTVNADGQTQSIITHVNAPAINLNNAPIRFKYTDANGHDQYKSLSDIGATIAWTDSHNQPDLSQASAETSYPVTITYSDGSHGSFGLKVTVIGAEGQDVVFNKKSTNEAPTITEQDVDHKTAISNENDLSQFGALITWKKSDGTAIDWTKPTLNHDGQVVAVPVTVTVHYNDHTTQDVNLNLKINGSASIDASHYTAVDNMSVHYGQDISNDAIGLIKHDGTTLTTANLASQGIQSVAWVTNPNTAVASANGEYDLTNQVIKITFADGSVLTKNTTVKVFSGYNKADKNVTIVSGDMPSEQDAKNAIANWATLSRDHQATSAAWAEDANGTAMDAPYVTSSTNTDKPAWVKITYSDGNTQVVQVNDLHITSQANGYRVREVTGGLNSHAVDSGAPDIGDLKQYFTVTDGSTNESRNVTSAQWITGHTPTWTSAGDTSGEVRLTFADGSSKDVDLNVHLVGINVPDTTESTYRNVVPTSAQAEAKVTNSSSLNPYHATYDWYSDRNATTRLQTTDVANPGTKTVYIGVKYHKVDGSDDGQQVKSITLTINNSSSQYRATNNATHSSITTHVGASVADFGNGSDYVTITKNDGSAVSASDIRSYSWTTPVDTADNARGNQTAVVTITFADSTTAQPDTLTVNVPVTVVKATAHNDIETNHDVPLNAKDQITNMSALNTNNFKVSDADVTWANAAHGAALPSDFWTTNSDSSTAIDPSGNRIVGKKGAWLIVNYKKADGTTPDGTQAIWAPVKIKSDRDNIDPTNTDAYNADHGIYKTHIGAEINGTANFGNVHLDDQIGFRDSHDTPMFVDAHGNATWRFDGFAKANASGTGYTPSDVDLNADNLTNGEHDITDLYAKINLPDGSTTYVKMNHVYVYGGYPHADNDDGTRFTKVANGGDLTDDQARDAIANNGTLTNAATVGDLNKATGFTWAKDANGSALSAADTSWHQGDARSNLDRTGYVIISYADGTKQAVEVHYDVIKDSDNTHINTDPTDPTGKRITGDPILAHVSNDSAAENVDGADAVVITEGSGSSAVQKTLSQIGASIAWDRSADMNTWVTNEHDAEWKDATITYHDGSTKAVQIKVKVVGASRKVSATAGQADVVTNHGVVPDASASINQPNATGAKWNIDNVQWADASGNVLNDTDRNNFFAGNTDSSSVTIDHTTYDKAKAGYILVSYKRNGQPDGTQLIEVPVQIKSDADNIDPNTGITFDRAQGNVVKTHANATTADPASGQITIKDNAGGDVSGWNFSGWATKDTAGHYDDVSSSALATDLNDHSLNADGLKEVNDVYAKITLADGSVIYTLAMKIQVLGGVGQSKTYDHTLTAPAASEGVKNYSAVHDAFDHATYSWVTPDNSDPSGYTDFTDFNTRTHDSDGNLAPNDNVYVKITWGDGTFQYVKAPVTIKGDNDIYADDVTANAQGLTLHVNTPSTEVIPDTGFTTQNIPSNIHVSYDWATGSGDEDGQPDVSTTDLTNGTKTVTKNVKITFTNTNGSTTSSIIKPLTVHVIGGYAASEHQSVQAGELPTAEQAKETIANNNNLSQFDKNNHQVTYEWFSDAAGNNRLSTTDTQLTGATGYKDVYVKITYPKADGTSDGSQMVKVTLNLTNDLAHQYAAQLSGKDITVVKSTTPLSGNDHAQEAVNVPSNLPAGTISSYEWSNPVNISTTGDKAGVVNVKFSDNSVVQVATIVHVVDHNETIADRTLVNGGEIWVAPDTQLDEHHGADQAKAGISNSSSLPAGTTYNWTAPVNTSTPGSEVAGIVKVTFTDGSSKNAGVVVHVRGIAPAGDQASRFVPQGNDLTKNLNDAVTASDAKAGIRNKATDTDVREDHRLPSDVQITWGSDVDGITSTTGDKAAIVKVTYADHSVDEVPIIIHVRDHRDASQSVEPLGQDIYKHNGDTLTNADAENAITNHAALANVRTYGFENNPVPMNNGHINIEGSSAVYGANIKITYNDDSIKLVPIFIHVTKDNSATPRPGYNRDADNINPFGKTIEKDMSQAALSDGVYSSTSSTDAQNAVGFPAGTDMSKVHNLTWADDNFKNNALKSEGLKSGVVKVTYADGSIDLVNVQVRVISEATRTNLTAKTIYRNYQDPNPVTATDGIVQTIPNDSQAEFVSPVNLDRQGRVINAGTYGETIRVHFNDGSSTILHTSLVVGAGNQTEADAYTPVGGMIIKYVGDTLNDHDAKSVISNSNSLPGDTTYNWTTPDSAHLELTNAGLKNGVVKVTFDDGSHQDVNVLIDVRSMADNPAYAPIGQTVHISTPSHTPLTGVGSGEGTAQNGIVNAAALANVLASSTATVHPADPFTWVGSIDISQAGTTPAMIKVSYKDGSSRNVAVNVVVGDPTTNPITGTLPRAQVIEGHYGDVFEDNSENAKKGIANTSDMPAGTTYRFEDASELPVDQTTHKLNQVGNNPVIIIVTDAQGYEKRVATVIHVVSDASLDTTTPIGQNITTTVGDPDHKVTPENGIANRNDLHNVATTGGYTWQDATPDVTSEGTKPAVVKITYADGSSKIVPISVIVNSTTPSTNPNQPVDLGHQTDADAIAPFGKTIEKDMSQTALTDGNYSNDSDAKDAVGFPAGTDTRKIGSLTWVDPSFKVNALRTSGYHAGQVRVTYTDGSSDIVTALVHVISMADRYNPTPRPVVVNPTDPSHPTDPSDPGNHTPGVDPSTVPSGTHTSWPTDPSGHPVIPDQTPGTHPGQIEIHYPDGSRTILPVPVVNPSDRDRYTPTPRPIPVTPGENPSDITNPTPAEPTPGVDHNSVPSGSHTILDPSQPAPDTTTPGTHPVHVIVVYPDGSQSDPIETNIVVPDENTPSYEDTSVGETISPVIIFRDNHDKAIKTLTDKISGYEGSTIPLETLKKLIAEEMPEGYALDMDLEQAWREGKFVITVNHPIYIKIVKVRRQLVLFVDKRGRIVKRAYVLIKESQKLSNEVVKSLTGKDMPKGYKMNGYKKVAKHIDIFVSGKQTKATSHGKLVLYVRKDGKIVKKLNIQLVANKFSKRNAKMHLPKGYKMTGHTHINRHNDVWVIKK